MKKRWLAIFLFAIAMLTGCSAEQKLTINADFSSVCQEDIYTTAADEDAIVKLFSGGTQDSEITYDEIMKEMDFSFAGTAVVNGEALVDLTGLSAGMKDAFIEFNSTDRYNNNISTTYRFNVYKNY